MRPAVLLALLAPWRLLAADLPWEPMEDRDGIVTERRPVEGSSLAEFQGHALVEASIGRVFSVIRDVPRRTEWMDRCIESRLLGEPPNRQVFYNRSEGIWPAADRDVVLMGSVEAVPAEHSIRVNFVAVPSDSTPPARDAVRMPSLVGHWLLTPAASGSRTSVLYRVKADPGGWIPGWVANLVSRRLPMETLAGLRRQTASVSYPDEETAFLRYPGVTELLRLPSPK